MLAQHGSDTDIPFLFSEYIASILRILEFRNVPYDVIYMTHTVLVMHLIICVLSAFNWLFPHLTYYSRWDT